MFLDASEFATSCSRSALLAVKNKLQPLSAKAIAIDFPIPPVAPDINAFLPLKIFVSNCFPSLRNKHNLK
jgi:hypothetical protein